MLALGVIKKYGILCSSMSCVAYINLYHRMNPLTLHNGLPADVVADHDIRTEDKSINTTDCVENNICTPRRGDTFAAASDTYSIDVGVGFQDSRTTFLIA